MTPQLRRRLRIELVLGAISLVLCVVTLISAEWIEELTGWDPDSGSGALEWIISLGFGVVSLALFVVARRDATRLRQAAA